MEYKIRASTLNKGSYKALEKEYKAVADWTITAHCNIKLTDRGITNEELFDVVGNGKLVEYHTLHQSRRVLIKDDKWVVVLDLKDHAVITVFTSGAYGQEENQLFGGS